MKTDKISVIMEDENPMRHAKPGETGIFARAGYIPVGYYNDPIKTEKTFVKVSDDDHTWMLSGDAV